MNRETPVSDFSFMSVAALEQLQKELGLSMTTAQLRLCQQYYLVEAHREPAPEELLFLDKTFEHVGSDPEFCLISEVTTRDNVMADEYAVLMRERTRRFPDVERPASLSEIAGLFSGDTPENAPALRAGAHDALLLAMAKKDVKISGNLAAGFTPNSTFVTAETPAPFDKIYAILPAFNHDYHGDGLFDLISSPVFRTQIKSAFPVKHSGLLPTLFAFEKGLDVDLSCFTRCNPFTCFEGILFAADPARVSDFLLAAEEKNLRTVCLGTIRKDTDFSVLFPGGTRYTFGRGLLSALLSGNFRSADIPKDQDEAPLDACEVSSLEIAKDKTLFCAFSSCEKSFDKVVKTALSAISYCKAAGVVPCGGIRLAADCPVCLDGASSAEIGAILSVILGINHVSRELGLGVPAITLTPGKSLSSVSLCATAFIPAPSERAIRKESTLFYLFPETDNTGMPLLDDLKKMYAYVDGLRGDGIILNASGLSASSSDAIGALGNGRDWSPSTGEMPAFVPGGMLVEAKCHIQGKPVGKFTLHPEVPDEEKKAGSENIS